MLCVSSRKKTDLSTPISIPKTTKKQSHKIIATDNYESTLNFFNPDKFSPPNSWNSRLLDRFYKQSNNILRD